MSDAKEKNDDGRTSLFDVVKVILGSFSVFTALSYILGRSFSLSYYYTIGINPNVLSFSAEDYMFFSYDIVVMCLVVIGCIYIYWHFRKSDEFIRTLSQNTTRITFSIIFVICMIYEYLLIFYPGLYLRNISGFIIGLSLGILSLFYLGMSKKIFRILLILIIIMFIIFLPGITKTLAQIEATNMIDNYPKVSVVYQDPLSAQSNNTSEKLIGIIDGRLIITNNGNTYILKSENVTDNWQVYAIPVDSIKEIVYFHEK